MGIHMCPTSIIAMSMNSWLGERHDLLDSTISIVFLLRQIWSMINVRLDRNQGGQNHASYYSPTNSPQIRSVDPHSPQP